MNKTDLINEVAKKSQLTREQASDAVDATFSCIEDALKQDDTVRIVGFGNFQIAKRKATTGRNPRTGEEVQIPASNVPKFRPGKALKDACNA